MTGPANGTVSLACDECLRRTWLLERLSGHINRVRRVLCELLEADDDHLIRATAGKSLPDILSEYRSWDRHRADQARACATAAGLDLLCCCEKQYPQRLLSLDRSVPRVLHIAGGFERFLELCEGDAIAIVGARRCTSYGRTVAHRLAADLAGVGVTVVSGMAAGIDSAGHDGALSTSGNTIAVMPGGANVSYPASARSLHRRIIERGVAISELGPGMPARAWTFRARNRIVVGLCAAVVVVQARRDSGSMRTAMQAITLRRGLGAVPGQIDLGPSEGPHVLIRDQGARLIGSSRDVLDLLGLPETLGQAHRTAAGKRPQMSEPQRQILVSIADGVNTAAGIAATGRPATDLLKDLAQLELMGCIRRGPGGQFIIDE
jgi:DNA processing protein